MKKVLPPFFRRNRFYIVSSLLLLVWLTIFDRSNLISQVKMRLDLMALEKQEEFYKTELTNLKKEEAEVMGSIGALENFAREKYWMKKEGETVFVLVDKDDKVIVEEENQKQ